MRKLIFALAVMVMGGFAMATGTPASAMSAGAVTTIGDIVTANASTESVHWRPYWHRHGHHRGYRHGWRHKRHCWWRYGRRYCRWGRY